MSVSKYVKSQKRLQNSFLVSYLLQKDKIGYNRDNEKVGYYKHGQQKTYKESKGYTLNLNNPLGLYTITTTTETRYSDC